MFSNKTKQKQKNALTPVVSFFFQIYDEDTLQQDKKMGVAKLAVNSLEPENPTEITLNVLQSLDSLKVKDNKGRGTLHLKVSSAVGAS